MGPIQSVADILSLLRRRFWMMALIVLAGMAGSYVIAKGQPRVWEAYATLRVELPRVSSDGLPQAHANLNQRLQLLQHELTSRDNLLKLDERFQILTHLPLSPAEKVTTLRQSITFDRIGTGNSGPEGQISAFVVGVRLGEPQVAADVANNLAQQVLEITNSRQSEMVRETLAFYAAEETRLREEITALEAQATTFKNANLEALPENITMLRDQIGALDTRLAALEQEVTALRQERDGLLARGAQLRSVEQRQLQNIENQLSTLEAQRRVLTTTRADHERVLSEIPTIQGQLAGFERQLAQLQEQFTAVNLRRAEAQTSQRLDSERQSERFEILDSALPPDYPMASGRKKVMIMGVGVSGMLALGLALLLELLNPVLRSARQFERVSGLKPVIVLPNLRPKG